MSRNELYKRAMLAFFIAVLLMAFGIFIDHYLGGLKGFDILCTSLSLSIGGIGCGFLFLSAYFPKDVSDGR